MVHIRVICIRSSSLVSCFLFIIFVVVVVVIIIIIIISIIIIIIIIVIVIVIVIVVVVVFVVAVVVVVIIIIIIISGKSGNYQLKNEDSFLVVETKPSLVDCDRIVLHLRSATLLNLNANLRTQQIPILNLHLSLQHTRTHNQPLTICRSKWLTVALQELFLMVSNGVEVKIALLLKTVMEEAVTGWWWYCRM